MNRIAPTNVLSNSDIISLASAAGATKPVADVSSRYNFISTLSIVDLLRDSGWLPVHAEQSGVRGEDKEGFQKHFLRFARPEFMLESERIDLLLYNSHSKTSSFKLMAGVWRFVCGNGMVVGTKYADFSHRHVGFDEGLFLESTKKIANSAETIANKVDELKTIELEPNEQGVFAMAAHQMLYGEEVETAPIQSKSLLDCRRSQDRGNDLWKTFNRVQENVIRGGLRGSKVGGNGRRRKVTTRPVKSLDRNRDLNQALWVLTEKMAELKQG